MFQEYKTYLESFMTDFDFPTEARIELGEAYETVFSDVTLLQELANAFEIYRADKNKGFPELMGVCKQATNDKNVHIYVTCALVLVLATKISKVHYQAEQIPLSVWKSNFLDLKYKLIECKLVKGIWGIFVSDWYFGFLNVSRFTFGKLQFEIAKLGCDYHKNSITLTSESPVINVHIPRTGTGLTPQDVEDACAEAANFFKEKYAIEPVVFVCNSWLLYPENKKMLKPTSNLYSFISRFDVIRVKEYSDYKEVWRLFDCDYTGDVSRLPADTSLRRAYIDRIKRGEKIGSGYGVFIYNPIRK